MVQVYKGRREGTRGVEGRHTLQPGHTMVGCTLAAHTLDSRRNPSWGIFHWRRSAEMPPKLQLPLPRSLSDWIPPQMTLSFHPSAWPWIAAWMLQSVRATPSHPTPCPPFLLLTLWHKPSTFILTSISSDLEQFTSQKYKNIHIYLFILKNKI